MKTYIPQPIDTGKVKLSADLSELTELLARNTHEVWAAQRLAQGWQYGAERNDAKKLHPCLVAYEDLPESEKEYDRSTAMETIKVIVNLGYKIEKYWESLAQEAVEDALKELYAKGVSSVHGDKKGIYKISPDGEKTYIKIQK